MIVAKFGGSSLADAAQFRRVRDIALADSRRQGGGALGPGQTLSQDEKGHRSVLPVPQGPAEGGSPFQPVLRSSGAHMGEIAENLGLALDLDGIFQQIWEQIARGAGRITAPAGGEFVNGQPLAEYLGFPSWMRPRPSFFDDDGKLDEEETNSLLQQELLEQVPVVPPGFYGRGPQGQIKVFSWAAAM